MNIAGMVFNCIMKAGLNIGPAAARFARPVPTPLGLCSLSSGGHTRMIISFFVLQLCQLLCTAILYRTTKFNQIDQYCCNNEFGSYPSLISANAFGYICGVIFSSKKVW